MSKLSVEFGAVDNGLDATIKRVNSGLDKLDSNAKQASGSFISGLKGMAVGGAVAGAAMAASMAAINAAVRGVSAVIGGFGDALDLGGELTDLSARTGETAGNLLILQRAFENNGVSADKVGSSINKLQKFMMEAGIGTEKNVDTIAALGLSMEELAGKTPTEQIRMFSERIAAIDDPTTRAGIAMQIFGKSGGELLPVILNLSGEIDNAKRQLGGMPDVMDRSAAAFDTISDNMTVLKSKLMEVAAGFMESATPALVRFTDMLTGIDAAGWGKNMMKTVTAFADFFLGVFKSPIELIEVMGLKMIAAAGSFGNGLIDSVGLFAEIASQTLNLVFNDVGGMLIDGFSNAWKVFALEGELAISKIKTSPGFISFTSMLKATWDAAINGADFQSSMNKYMDAAISANDGVVSALQKQLGEANRQFEDGLVDGSSKVAARWEDIKVNTKLVHSDFFKVGEISGLVDEKWNNISENGKKLRADIDKSMGSSSVIAKDAKKLSIAGADVQAGLEKGAKALKAPLTLLEKILAGIKEAENAQGLDRGGKLQNKIKQEIEDGNFKQARRLAGRLGEQEQEQAIRGNGKDRDRRNLVDIAKAEGINTFRMSRDQIRDAITKKRQENLKPENKGLNKEQQAQKDAADKPAKADPVEMLTTIVKEIRGLVAKIEPKLPQHALN